MRGGDAVRDSSKNLHDPVRDRDYYRPEEREDRAPNYRAMLV